MEAITTIPSILPTGDAILTLPSEDATLALPSEDATPALPSEDAEIAAMFSMLKKKKKKPKVEEIKSEVPSVFKLPTEIEDTDELTYDEMLSRIYEKMGAVYTASELALKRLQRPKMVAIGTKRVGWTNFEKTAKTLNRTLEHISSFIEAEFGTTISIDGSNSLIIKGRFSAEQLESVLKKYVEQYIKCRTCKSMDTKLERDPDTRLYFVKCESCKSQWSVAAIQKGFHATMKGDRKAARAAE